MAETLRIEIPVEAVNKTDMGSFQQLESMLQRLFDMAKQGSSSSGFFNGLQQGAHEAQSSLNDVENAAERASQKMDEISDSADFGQAAAQSANEAENAVDELGDAADDAGDSLDDLEDAAQGAGHGVDTSLNEAGSSADKFTQRIMKSAQQLRQAFAEKFQLVMQAVDKASPAIKNIQNTIKGIVGKAWKVTVKIADFVTAPFRKILGLITSPITMALSVAGVGMGASDFLNTFTEFKTGMSNVQALSGATNEEFVELTKTAQELGATTKFTAAQASEGMQYLAMAGWDTNEIISAMPGLLQLAAAGATDLGTASDIVSDVMTAMGMGADEATRAADVFARTATSTNTTISNMGETLKYAAPIAHSFGLSLEEVSTITGLMANAGVKGSQAGTAIRSALLAMASPTTEAQKAMSKLGLSFADSQGKMKDMKTIVRDLVGAFSGLSEQEQLNYADAIFGKMASSGWLGIINQGTEAYDQLYESIMNSDGAAQEMADIQLDNLAGDFTLLQSAADGMKISLMDKLDPYLRKGVQWITAQIPAITEMASGLIDTVIQKAGQIKDRFTEVFDSSEFQNADTFAEKIMIAWDKVIAQPFSEWWSSSGQESVLGIVQGVGENLGQAYHGVIAGIIAALKGEEIDADALNLTGIGKAGAEVAKEFISSFAGAFDLGGLFSEVPGALKAGFFGFLGLKAGGVGMSLAKDVSAIKIAFSGIGAASKPAEAAVGGLGVTASKTGGIFAGLKGLISAVPGWGWAVAGAIAAVAVGVTLYNKHLQKQKEELWALGDAVEESQTNFQQTAQKANQTMSSLNELNTQRHEIEFQLRVTRMGLTDEAIAGMKERVTEIDGQISELAINISQGGNITAEEAVEVATQLAGIQSETIELTATILTSGGIEQDKEVFGLLEQYDLAQFDPVMKASVEADILAHCDDPAQAQKVKELLVQYSDPSLSPIEKAQVAAEIAANITGNTEPKALMDLMKKYSTIGVPEDPVQLEAELTAACGNPEQAKELVPLFQKYGRLQDNEAEIKASLDASGVTPEQVSMLEQLASLISERDKLSLAIEAGEMNGEDVEALKKQYDEVLQKIQEVSGGAVDAKSIEAGAIDGVIEKYNQQLEVMKEIARIQAETDLKNLGEKMPEIIKGEAQARTNVQQKQAEIDAATRDYDTSFQLYDDYKTLEGQREQKYKDYQSGKISEDDYRSYMLDAGGYIEQAQELVGRYRTLTGADEDTARTDAINAGGSMLNNLDYLYNGSTGSVDELFRDGFGSLITDFNKQNQLTISDLEGQLTGYQAEQQKYASERMQYYSGMESQQTAEHFKGTEYEGMNLADIASKYSEFANNPVMVQAFESAVSALDSLNTDLIKNGYMGQDEVTSVDKINEIRNASLASSKAEQAGATEGGGTTEGTQYRYTPEEAYSYLSTQNTMSGGDTKFTRDLAANMEEYNEAIKNGGDTTQILEDRKNILGKQQEYIQAGIEGVQQYTTQINAQKQAIQETTEAEEAKDYQGTIDQINQLKQAYTEAYATGGSEGAAAFEGSSEAASSLESINAALEGLGLDKIESLSQLGEALASVNTAQTEGQSAITTLNEELANLQAGQVDLIVQTCNALDSLTWNMNNINSDGNIADALKIDESIAGNIDSLQSSLANAGSAASGTAGNFDTVSGAANTARDSANNLAGALKAVEGTYQCELKFIFQQPQIPSIPSGFTKVGKNAEGGIYDGSMLSLVAEDGPEAIIPLSAKRRDRGLKLWEQAGRMLGVEQYAEGGIMEPYADALESLPDDVFDEEGGGPELSPAPTGGSTGSTVTVRVDASPVFQIDAGGNSPEDFMAIIRSKQNELAEILGSAIADQMQDIVSNMV